jgi:diacylglycerol kinase
MVWITEAVNTAIEFLVDLISPEFNPLAGHIKDIAAAAVLLSALAAIIIGCIIFIPELLYLFRG